jgi:hypothetical protein
LVKVAAHHSVQPSTSAKASSMNDRMVVSALSD